LTDVDEVGAAAMIILRVVAFIVGVALLISGIVDFGSIGSDITIGLSMEGLRLLKFLWA
jgi:ABC-type transporter Mla maintaining outer membrane lipid asymmetry permease subunit MlaE